MYVSNVDKAFATSQINGKKDTMIKIIVRYSTAILVLFINVFHMHVLLIFTIAFTESPVNQLIRNCHPQFGQIYN